MILPRTILVALLIVALIGVARADDENTDRAIASGLTYLARQQAADGSFGTSGKKLETTGLSLLAFLSTGNTADGGRYAANVRRATEFLLRQAPADHYFGAIDGSQMRGQAIVTFALCQAYGVEPDEATRVRIRAAVKDATAPLIAAQNVKKAPDQDGGWSDGRTSAESDPEISRWCLDALRAAQRIGIGIPQAQTVDRAAAYVAGHKQRTAATQSTSDHLLSEQLPDGSWPANDPVVRLTRIEATAEAILKLAESSSATTPP